MKKILGFTGRASGVTDAQRETLHRLLSSEAFSEGWTALHNDGDGGDQLFADFAVQCGFEVETTRDDLRPMPRNRELVARADRFIALPPTDHLLKKGSGSWETIKYVWKAGKPVQIVLSDGQIVREKSELPRAPQL